MKRIGILGAGGHASQQHGEALKRAVVRAEGHVELTAVCDAQREKAERFAAAYGARRVFDRLDTMLDETPLDGLLAITPLALTEALVTQLLPHGIPLLIEKPTGETSAAAERLLALARHTGTPHGVSFNRRFSPALAHAQRWLTETAAAQPPTQAIVRMYRHDRREPDFITGTGVHALDAIAALLGQPVGVTAWPLPARGVAPRAFQARIAFAHGAAAHVAVAPASGTTEETYEMVGPDYTLLIDVLRCRLTIVHNGRYALEWQAPDDMPPCERDGTLYETEAFIRALSEGFSGLPDLHDGLTALRVAEAMAREGDTDIPAPG